MRAWTDYPFEEAGDAPGKLAPLRLVRVLSWDRDKYCEIECLGEARPLMVKHCYLYKERGRLHRARQISLRQLKKLPPLSSYLK